MGGPSWISTHSVRHERTTHFAFCAEAEQMQLLWAEPLTLPQVAWKDDVLRRTIITATGAMGAMPPPKW
jgi:hypothetical protein